MTAATFFPARAVIDAAALRRAVAFAGEVPERWNTVPILGMIRLTGNGDQLSVRGSDLDIEVEMSVEAVLEGDLDLVLSPRLLSGLIRHASGTVTIYHIAEALIRIEAGDVTCDVRPVCKASDWPAIVAKDAQSHDQGISAAVLHRALQSVAICISTKETRYYLNGVYMHDKDGLVCVATDGRRLARYETGEAWGHMPIILPSKAVGMLRRRCATGGNDSVMVRQLIVERKPVKLTIAGLPLPGEKAEPETPEMWAKAVRFAGEGWRITSKVIDGKYPDYDRVIAPPADDISVGITMAALQRFPNLDQFNQRPVEFRPADGKMVMRYSDGTVVNIPVQGRGAPFGLQLRYIKDFARLAGTVRIEGSGANEPFRVLTEDPRLTNVIMPMRS